MLSVEGNPLILAPKCHDVIKESLPWLKMIDGITIFHEKNNDTARLAHQNSSGFNRMESMQSNLNGEATEDLSQNP